MKRRRPPGIWVTNHLANPVLRPLLHGPAGRRLGRRLALIRYSGRRTGRVYELPVQYARDGDRVWILPAADPLAAPGTSAFLSSHRTRSLLTGGAVGPTSALAHREE